MYFKEKRLQELKVSGDRLTAKYLSTHLGEELIFLNLEGSLVQELGIEPGITFQQFSDLYNGRWGDYQAKLGPSPIKEPDPDRPGKFRYRTDPVTGKRLTEPTHTPYSSLVVALDKDKTLAVLAMHKRDPEKAQQMVDAVLQANRTAAQAIERQVAFLRAPAEEVSEVMAMAGASPATVKATAAAKGTRRVPGAILDILELQESARPTDASLDRRSQLPDPHLHVHHTIPHMGQLNGRWLTPDNYDLFKGRTYELVAQTVDAEVVRMWMDLGVPFDFERNNRGRIEAKVAGIPNATVRGMSTNQERTKQVADEFAAREGRPPSNKELNVAMSATRHGKSKDAKDMDTNPDRDAWVAMIEEEGYDLPALEHRDYKPLSLHERTKILRERLAQPDGLTRDGPVIASRMIENAVVRNAIDLGFTPDELRIFEADLRQDLIMTIGRDDRSGEIFDAYTTPEHWAMEARVEQAQDRIVEQKVAAPVPSEEQIKKTIAAAELKRSLPYIDEHHVLHRRFVSNERLVIIDAEAGAMKTSISGDGMNSLMLVDPKLKGIVVSPARKTAIESAIKINAKVGHSFESLLFAMGYDENGAERDLEPGARVLKLDEHSVIVIDEAAMVDTPRWSKFLEIVEPTGARIRLIGDPHQLQPIGCGGWYQDLTAKHPDSVVRVTKAMRQKDERDLAACRQVRQGRADLALDYLVERGRFHVAQDAQHRVAEVANWYDEQRTAGRDDNDVQILIDGANTYLDQINFQIQQQRLRRDEITEVGVEVEQEETGRSWTIHGGDRILMLDGVGLGRNRIVNGETGKVLKVFPDKGTAVVSVGRKGRIEYVKLDASFGLGYAANDMKLQGSEALAVAELPSSHTNKWHLYTGMSRAIEEYHIFSDYETHGGHDGTEEPRDVLARLGAYAPPTKSAHRVMREAIDIKFAVEPDPHAPDGNPSRSEGAAADTRLAPSEVAPADQRYIGWLAEHGGEAFAQRAHSSEAWPTLRMKLDAAERNGEDARTKLFDAINRRSVGDAQDLSALLSWRLDRTQPRGDSGAAGEINPPAQSEALVVAAAEPTAVVHLPHPTEEPAERAPEAQTADQPKEHEPQAKGRTSWRELWSTIRDGGLYAGEKPQKADTRWGDKIDKVFDEIEREHHTRSNEASKRVAETIIGHKAAQAEAAWRAEAKPWEGPKVEPTQQIEAGPEVIVTPVTDDWRPSENVVFHDSNIYDAELVDESPQRPEVPVDEKERDVQHEPEPELPDIVVPELEPLEDLPEQDPVKVEPYEPPPLRDRYDRFGRSEQAREISRPTDPYRRSFDPERGRDGHSFGR